VIPFFGKGLPIEYELTRSLRTVSAEKRLKLGVLLTDAQVNEPRAQGGGRWEIVRELQKQYEVEQYVTERRHANITYCSGYSAFLTSAPGLAKSK
jgi:ABC-2 type transport system permease protein